MALRAPARPPRRRVSRQCRDPPAEARGRRRRCDAPRRRRPQPPRPRPPTPPSFLDAAPSCRPSARARSPSRAAPATRASGSCSRPLNDRATETALIDRARLPRRARRLVPDADRRPCGPRRRPRRFRGIIVSRTAARRITPSVSAPLRMRPGSVATPATSSRAAAGPTSSPRPDHAPPRHPGGAGRGADGGAAPRASATRSWSSRSRSSLPPPDRGRTARPRSPSPAATASARLRPGTRRGAGRMSRSSPSARRPRTRPASTASAT